MSEPLARLYDLALRTLDDQERRADALRARLGPVLAAAALGVTLLSGPLVGGERPATALGNVMLLVALSGFFAAVFEVMVILGFRGLVATETDARAVASNLDRRGALEDAEAFYVTMIARFGPNVAENAALLDRLHARFTAMLCGILVMLCGLAATALVG